MTRDTKPVVLRDEVSGYEYYVSPNHPDAKRPPIVDEDHELPIDDIPTVSDPVVHEAQEYHAEVTKPYEDSATWVYEDVLDEARRLVDGQRGGDYGHPMDDFDALGRFFGAILQRWLEGRGVHIQIPDVPAEIVSLMLDSVKINRHAFKQKRDNVVDGIGYWFTQELIERKRMG